MEYVFCVKSIVFTCNSGKMYDNNNCLEQFAERTRFQTLETKNEWVGYETGMCGRWIFF